MRLPDIHFSSLVKKMNSSFRNLRIKKISIRLLLLFAYQCVEGSFLRHQFVRRALGKETLFNVKQNTLKLPISTIEPLSSTAMRSAFMTVERRCAMMIHVRPVRAASSTFCTTSSDSASQRRRCLVQQQQTRRAHLYCFPTQSPKSSTNALAMATRCFCPPDNVTPRSPTSVSKPCRFHTLCAEALAKKETIGREVMKS